MQLIVCFLLTVILQLGRPIGIGLEGVLDGSIDTDGEVELACNLVRAGVGNRKGFVDGFVCGIGYGFGEGFGVGATTMALVGDDVT